MQSAPAPLDSDGDGMPDEWELRRGLNPNDAADGPGDSDGDGYTNVEDYLNGLIPLQTRARVRSNMRQGEN